MITIHTLLLWEEFLAISLPTSLVQRAFSQPSNLPPQTSYPITLWGRWASQNLLWSRPIRTLDNTPSLTFHLPSIDGETRPIMNPDEYYEIIIVTGVYGLCHQWSGDLERLSLDEPCYRSAKKPSPFGRL
ncbi:hypothetical protein NP233_g12534 [Leucocoprinus birnbaumii]|uniref:Uncharacterized protein n=1 Tax=Leucocoprinus birnbaumii TaxID=56174 RepID=A0AAD5YPX9_9AGAR|nr:hypothetical protein NP233_g12534 [Leucocoprinus birnbaumii]